MPFSEFLKKFPICKDIVEGEFSTPFLKKGLIETIEWFKDLKKTVTNNPLRFIIPMDSEKGTIMISYTDDVYCNYWEKRRHDQAELKKSIVNFF